MQPVWYSAMAVKTKLQLEEIEEMLSVYNIGADISAEPVLAGSVETNYRIQTETGRYILKYYEERTMEQVAFEKRLCDMLGQKAFPCAKVIPTVDDQVPVYAGKPYLLFTYVEGQSIPEKNEEQTQNLIEQIALFLQITKNQKLEGYEKRLTYCPKTCQELVHKKVLEIGEENAIQKERWYLEELNRLELPETLTMGICHSDYDVSNILFEGNEVRAIIDFDDANYTYLYFDIVSFINFFRQDFTHDTWWKFKPEEEILDFEEARKVLKIFQRKHDLSEIDRWHMYDILKLGILVDCIWYFSRGEYQDFYEKRKIDALNRMERGTFYLKLFKG